MTDFLDFRGIFDASPNAYMLLDRDLRYVDANATYLALTGSSLEALRGRHILEAFPNDPADPNNASARRLEASLRRVVETGRVDELPLIPYLVPRAPGAEPEERFWSATHTPLRDAAGRVTHVLQHTVDVTDLERLRRGAGPAEPGAVAQGVLGRAEQVQAQNVSLDRELRFLRGLWEQAPGFVCFLSGPEHRFALANAAYQQLVGHREVLGKPIREALPELAGQGYFELLERVRAGGEPYVAHAAEVQLRRTPGGPLETVYLDFVYQPVLDPEGRPMGIFVQGQDVSPQRRLEGERERLLQAEREAREEAERASRLKDEFLATVSHELRTPLSAILGWAQLLRTGALPAERRERGLETIERNARAQSQLIEDLLDVSRIISGKLTLEVAPVELGGVVEAALESVRPSAEAKGIRLRQEPGPSAVVSGDAGRLQQVVWNLLSNAIKFTPGGGCVRVAVAAAGGSAEVRVADDGQGIAREFLPRVFDRFSQAEGSAARKNGGLGLGLAIVKHLVESHGGTIAATSDGEGRGATFTLRLPLAAPARRAPAPAGQLGWAGLPRPPELEGLRVMVVDDDPDARELLQELLEGRGMRAETAASAPEALDRLRLRPPDLLVTDLAMPGQDGFQLIRQVRALPEAEGGAVPAVALTAYARAEDRTRVLLAGFRAHVPKPVDPAELLAVLASLVPRAR